MLTHIRIVSAAAILTASAASHAALVYSESASGDLPSTPLTTLQLSIGSNVVTGTTSFESPLPFSATIDSDSFRFGLPAGASITGISLAFSLTNNGAALPLAHWRIGPAEEAVDFAGGSPVSMFSSLLPIAGPGPVEMIAASALCDCGPGEGWSAAYTLTVAVAAVPEPSLSILFGAGIALVGFAARRRSPVSG